MDTFLPLVSYHSPAFVLATKAPATSRRGGWSGIAVPKAGNRHCRASHGCLGKLADPDLLTLDETDLPISGLPARWGAAATIVNVGAWSRRRKGLAAVLARMRRRSLACSGRRLNHRRIRRGRQ